MVSRQAARLVAETPAIAAAHFAAEADPYQPRRNPGGYVNLGTAENRLVWDLLAPRLRAAREVTEAVTRYAPLFGAPELREAVAALLTRTRRAVVEPADVLVVAGATAALDIIATVLCDPGEAIAVPVPYYGAFDTDLAGRSQADLVRVRPDEDGDILGAAAIEHAVARARAGGRAVRALVLTSPHNPLGFVYRPDELTDIAAVCARLDLDLICDEIYANSVFSGPPFVTALNLPAEVIDPRRVHVVWGFAKDFGLPGFKVGVLHIRHPAARAAARELAYFAPVSTDTQWLLCQLLADDAWVDGFLAANRSRLAASHAAAADLLAQAGIRFVPAVAGFSIWTDLRPWLAEQTFAAERALWRRLFEDGRVSMLPGEVFHSHSPGWFRLCHTNDPDAVHEGITRLSRVTGDRRHARPAGR
jgi:aspartate/methionine/tyrosine aminotransferase